MINRNDSDTFVRLSSGNSDGMIVSHLSAIESKMATDFVQIGLGHDSLTIQLAS
jgi:hypothetical protein